MEINYFMCNAMNDLKSKQKAEDARQVACSKSGTILVEWMGSGRTHGSINILGLRLTCIRSILFHVLYYLVRSAVKSDKPLDSFANPIKHVSKALLSIIVTIYHKILEIINHYFHFHKQIKQHD